MKIINAVGRMMGFIAAGLLLPMMLLTAANVFMRYVFNRPIMGTFEVTELMMVCLMLGIAWTGIQKRHIAVDLLVTRFSPRGQAIIGILTTFAGFIIGVIITWRCTEYALRVVLKDQYIVSVLLPIPLFPFHLIFIISIAMLCLIMLTVIIQRIAGIIRQ